MGITVEIVRGKLKLSAAGERRWSQLAAKKNVEQIRAGVSNTGAPFPKGIDLYDSGDLQKKVSVDADSYTFTVPYAKAVDDRFHFQGLSPAYEAKLVKELEAGDSSDFYIENQEG